MSVKLEKGLVYALAGIGVARPRLPQPPTFPALRFQRISTIRKIAVDAETVGVTEATVQVDCLAETYIAAKELADSVRGVLHGYSGTWGEITSPETHLTAQLVKLQTENDFSDQDGDKIAHWVSQRYQIWTNMD